jgi:hypothetical protein
MMIDDFEPGLLSESQARKWLGGVSAKSLFNWRRSGQLRAVKIGKIVRYEVTELQRFIAANLEAPVTAV